MEEWSKVLRFFFESEFSNFDTKVNRDTMRIITILTLFMVVAGCSKSDYASDEFFKMYGSGTDDVGFLIEEVSKHKIYFGHQSVGHNILGGLESWEEETGVSLDVADSREFSSVASIPFVHFSIGRNGDFRGKVDDFVSLMEMVPPEEKPVAFFKFCFVDVTGETDVESDFVYFREKMIYLMDQYPNITFFVCTVPYTAVQKGLKALVKNILGRDPYGVIDNIKRQALNERIINGFMDILPVFDLAALESTHPDGSIETYVYNGTAYPCLSDSYRTDYGHLNDFGARMVSYNLLAFLAEELK
jgi:hypothetical protein